MVLIIIVAIIFYLLSCYVSYKYGVMRKIDPIRYNLRDFYLYVCAIIMVIIILFVCVDDLRKEKSLQQIPRDLLNGKIQYRINTTIENGEIIKVDTLYYYIKK